MKEISKQVLATAIELAIWRNNKQIKTPLAGFKLRATIRGNEDSLLKETLDNLKDAEAKIQSWKITGDYIEIILADEQKIPKVDTTDAKDIIHDRALQRALLYRLYEEYRKSGDRYVHYSLVNIKDILESSKEEILRLVTELNDDYYLEYGVLDGGMCTSDLTSGGINLCQDKTELFSAFGTIQFSDTKNEQQIEDKSNSNLSDGNKKVFIVHGHDEAARETVARFIECIDLKPIILHEQANEGRTIIEKFEHNADVGFAVVLLSPDDEGRKKTEDEILQDRARQNVILELGYFIGKLGRKHVCALHKGSVEIPTDYLGVLFIPFDKDGGWQLKLAKELRSVGFDIDMNKVVA